MCSVGTPVLNVADVEVVGTVEIGVVGAEVRFWRRAG
jgi:hypothetical protein